MAESMFSMTQNTDDPCLPCQQGNVFAAYCPQGGPALTAYVNGQGTKIPQMGPLAKNNHSLAQTTGALELEAGGQRRTIIADLTKFEINKPEEVGLAIGMLEVEPAPAAESTNYQPKGRLMEYAIQTTSEVESDDVYNLAIPSALASLAPQEGEIDIETADERTIRWLAVNIVTVLGRIDETTGVQALADSTYNDVDFTLTGTNAVPLAIELTDMLKEKGNRNFLREIFKNNTKLSKVWTNASGKLMVSFRGYAGLRAYLNASSYGVGNTKVSVISSAVRNSNQWAGTLKSVGGRIPIISYIIVGVIDVAEWLALPEAEQDFSDLLATLFVDISKIALSVIAGTVAAAFAVFAIASAPVLLVVGAGMGVSIVVGILLDIIDNIFGITGKVKDLANEVEESIDVFLNHTNTKDGRVTGLADFMAEIEHEFNKYIYRVSNGSIWLGR